MLDRRRFLSGSATVIGAAAASGITTRLAAAGSGVWPRAPIEIVDDPFGIPHIRAASIPDAFFGQGYVVARDRLFQIDLAPSPRARAGWPKPSAPLSPKHDAAARLFHYRGDLDAELRRVPAMCSPARAPMSPGSTRGSTRSPPTPRCCRSNMRILGITPMRWDVRDLVLARGDRLAATSTTKSAARSLPALGLLDLDAVVAPLQPGLDDARARRARRRGGVAKPISACCGSARLPFGPTDRRPAPRPRRRSSARNAGSNAWTVGAAAAPRPGARSSPTIRISASAASARATSRI